MAWQDAGVGSTVEVGEIADGAVTPDKLAAAVAGNGLAGGAGTALSVGVDGSTLEVSGDALRQKDGGTTNAKLAGDIARAKMIEEALTRYQIPLLSCCNIDGSLLDTTGGAGKFKVVGGGWGAGDLQLRSETANNNTKTDYLRLEYMLPPEYVDGADAQFSVTIDYVEGDTVGTATVDIEAYEITDNGAAGGDINSTAEDSWYAPPGGTEMTFVITPTGLVAGDRLGILLKLVIQESMVANSYAWIGSMEMKLDIKG